MQAISLNEVQNNQPDLQKKGNSHKCKAFAKKVLG